MKTFLSSKYLRIMLTGLILLAVLAAFALLADGINNSDSDVFVDTGNINDFLAWEMEHGTKVNDEGDVIKTSLENELWVHHIRDANGKLIFETNDNVYLLFDSLILLTGEDSTRIMDYRTGEVKNTLPGSWYYCTSYEAEGNDDPNTVKAGENVIHMLHMWEFDSFEYSFCTLLDENFENLAGGAVTLGDPDCEDDCICMNKVIGLTAEDGPEIEDYVYGRKPWKGKTAACVMDIDGNILYERSDREMVEVDEKDNLVLRKKSDGKKEKLPLKDIKKGGK